MTDLAIYPVLFTEYLMFFFPSASALKIPICLAVIWISTYLNLRGVLLIGRSSVTLGVAVLVPFLVLFAAALFTPSAGPSISAQPTVLPGVGLAAICMGLFNVMWNFLGWDNAFTIAEEVDTPVRSYLVAMSGALGIIVVMYFFSILAGMISGIDPASLEAEGFPVLGGLLGGWWLGALLAAGGMASTLGLFLAILLSISRIPKVMADDGLLPNSLRRLHPGTNVPHVAVLTCAVAVSFMVLWDFSELLIIDVTLYSSALMPEFIALIVLRKKLPHAHRPFRISLNTLGLTLMTLFPLACILLALVGLFASETVHLTAAWFALATVLTAPLAWVIVRPRASST